MTLKKTDLYKNLAHKVDQERRRELTPDRFAQGAALDRKEQRKLDQAKGLIPFACKLDKHLVEQLREQAVSRQIDINEVVDQLLRKALAQ